MREYKAEITLNEEDSLVDLLTQEKNLVKLYSTALTESVNKGARSVVFGNLNDIIDDQIRVFFLLTELDYLRVESVDEREKDEKKQSYCRLLEQLKNC